MKNSIPENRQPLVTLFLDRNSKINLSAIRDPEGVYNKHILDSLEIHNCSENPIRPQMQVLDIGTGWGFPLLPLSVTFPETEFVWLDARKKKVTVVTDMATTLWLDNCTTVRSRVEEHKKRYDVVTARWVAYADQLLQRAVPKVKKKWYILLWKQFTFEEDADIRELCHQYKLFPVRDHQYTLPWDSLKRVIYCLRKQ